MKIHILFFASLALQLANARIKNKNEIGDVYSSDNLYYKFYCYEDNKNICKKLKKNLHEAADSLSNILKFHEPVKFVSIVDNTSKYRVDKTKDGLTLISDTNFEKFNELYMETPYPNSKKIIKKLNLNSDGDYKNSTFILMLNNFKNNMKYFKTEKLDDKLQLQSELIKGIFEGLRINNKLYYPYIKKKNEDMGGAKFHLISSFKEIIDIRKNLTQLYEDALTNDEECYDYQTENLLHTILHWKDTLISNDFNKNFSPKKKQPKRIVAVGDIHGDYDKLIKILRHAKIIDKKNNWIGKNSILIQMGDLIDRGEDIIKILDFMMKLRKQASKSNGIVYMLLGNHEVKNIQGNHQFTSQADIDSFGGILKRDKEFSMEGKYGKLLRSEMNATMIIDDTVFVHAGISPDYAKMGIDNINDAVHDILTHAPSFEELQEIDSRNETHPLYDDPLFKKKVGPLEFRDYSMITDESVVCPLLEETLEIMKAKRMVVAHTVQDYGKIVSKCDSKIILIDVGLSYCYGDHFAYLEFLNDKHEIWARYNN